MAEADGRVENAGRPDGPTAKVEAARDTAPEEHEEDARAIASVGWAAYQRGVDPAEIWREVAGGE